MNAHDLNALKVGIDQFKSDIGMKTGTKANQPPAPSLESRLEPGQSVASAPGQTATSPGRKYTIAEVKKFYLDCSKGHWRNRESERLAIDKDIVLAQQQGRIIP
jgi:hypothetical protein